MRRVIHAQAWFTPDDDKKVRHLAKMQSSAKRCAYQSIRRKKLVGEEVRQHVKSRFGNHLNTRMISDAVYLVKAIQQDHVVFGGKKAWVEMVEGKMPKEGWQLERDGQLYSRGDRSLCGNPNIRLYGDRILVNDPSGRNQWIEGRLWWPEKFRGKIDLACYDVRLVAAVKNGVYKVVATWDDEVQASEIDTSRGVIGIDCNPNGVAVIETDASGNILEHVFLHDSRLEHARHGKRIYAARQLAVKIVQMAQETGKPIAMEELSMASTKKGEKNRKGRRRCNNFASQLQREAVLSRATRLGVGIKMVNPAYTSVLGLVKYARMYSLNRHTAAAMVIARRGMGLKERKDFDVVERQKRRTRVNTTSRTRSIGEGGRLNLEGRSRTASIKSKGHAWMVDSFIKPRREAYAVLTAPNPAPVLGSKAGKRLRQQGEPSRITAQGCHREVQAVETTAVVGS